MNVVRNVFKKYPGASMATMFAIPAATAGAIRGYNTDSVHNAWTGETEHFSKEQRKRHAIIGGAFNGALGAGIGYHFHNQMFARKAPGAAQAAVFRDEAPAEFRHIKTKAQARKLKHDFSRANHPDFGHDEKKYQDWMERYQRFEKHPDFPKTAMAAFVSEMMAILGQ